MHALANSIAEFLVEYGVAECDECKRIFPRRWMTSRLIDCLWCCCMQDPNDRSIVLEGNREQASLAPSIEAYLEGEGARECTACEAVYAWDDVTSVHDFVEPECAECANTTIDDLHPQPPR